MAHRGQWSEHEARGVLASDTLQLTYTAGTGTKRSRRRMFGDRLITGQNPASPRGVGEALVAALVSRPRMTAVSSSGHASAK